QQLSMLNAALRTSLGELRRGPATDNGIAVGESVAKKVLDWRDADRYIAKSLYKPTTQVGRWQPTPPDYRAPLLPEWAGVRPFALRGTREFHPPDPPALDSKEFIAAYREVKDLGGKASSSRTADQTEIAKFWADGEGTVTPPGHWNRIAVGVAAMRKLPS